VRRRDLLQRTVAGVAAVGATALAGCTVAPGIETTPGPTGGTLELTVTNDSVTARRVEIEVRNGAGEVVDRHVVPALPRGETHRFERGHYRDTRYAVEVVVADRRLQHTWEPAGCPNLAFDVTVPREGPVASEARCP